MKDHETRLGGAYSVTDSSRIIPKARGLIVFAVSSLLAMMPFATNPWDIQINGTADGFDHAYAVAVHNSGDVIAAGMTNDSERLGQFTVGRFSSSTGLAVWMRELDVDGSHDYAKALAIDSNGDVFAGGLLADADTTVRFAVAKLDGETGAVSWQYRAPLTVGSGGDVKALAVDGNDDAFAVGWTWHEGADMDATVVKLDGDTGEELWNRSYASSYGVAQDDGKDIAVNVGGDVVVAAAVDRDFAVIKLDGATGDEIWFQRFDVPAIYTGAANAVAFDATGDVIASGISDNYFTVAKFDGDDGTPLWVQKIRGTDSTQDYSYDVAVDSFGDVLASGMLRNENPQSDFSIVKFDGTSGEEEWRVSINGSKDWGQDIAYAVVVDQSDDVVASGVIENIDTGGEFTVVKLAGDNGSVLWHREFAGTAEGYRDSAVAVAVDDADDVVAAGSFVNSGLSNDFTVVKLFGEDGTYVASTTPTGSGVEVTPQALDELGNPLDDTPVVLTFDEVTSAGNTNVTLSSSGPPPPSGFQLGDPPIYFDVETSAIFENSVEICFYYGGIEYQSPAQLQLFHFVDGVAVEITTSNDVGNRIICGETDSFSSFVVAEPMDADADSDGVLDENDMCPETEIPESVPTVKLRKNRWALIDADTTFDTLDSAPQIYTTIDTGGCSCEQIVNALALGIGHIRFGCSNSVMISWITSVPK